MQSNIYTYIYAYINYKMYTLYLDSMAFCLILVQFTTIFFKLIFQIYFYDELPKRLVKGKLDAYYNANALSLNTKATPF